VGKSAVEEHVREELEHVKSRRREEI
jgi:hypothetical protein